MSTIVDTSHRSTNVNSVEHDGMDTMTVNFKSGKSYRYSGITAGKAHDVAHDSSPGSALHKLGVTGSLIEQEQQ